jgi:hypothetical protein
MYIETFHEFEPNIRVFVMIFVDGNSNPLPCGIIAFRA